MKSRNKLLLRELSLLKVATRFYKPSSAIGRVYFLTCDYMSSSNTSLRTHENDHPAPTVCFYVTQRATVVNI